MVAVREGRQLWSETVYQGLVGLEVIGSHLARWTLAHKELLVQRIDINTGIAGPVVRHTRWDVGTPCIVDTNAMLVGDLTLHHNTTTTRVVLAHPFAADSVHVTLVERCRKFIPLSRFTRNDGCIRGLGILIKSEGGSGVAGPMLLDFTSDSVLAVPVGGVSCRGPVGSRKRYFVCSDTAYSVCARGKSRVVSRFVPRNAADYEKTDSVSIHIRYDILDIRKGQALLLNRERNSVGTAKIANLFDRG
jgi:hypothetical protein